MGFFTRLAVAVVSLPSLLKAWPAVQLLPLGGALLEFLIWRYVKKQLLKQAALRALILWAAAEVIVSVMLVLFQAYFYWTPG